MKQIDGITLVSRLMDGKAGMSRMCVIVGNVVGQLGAARAIQELLWDFPYMELEDIF
jgi:uncharacterized protein (DUF433 family)